MHCTAMAFNWSALTLHEFYCPNLVPFLIVQGFEGDNWNGKEQGVNAAFYGLSVKNGKTILPKTLLNTKKPAFQRVFNHFKSVEKPIGKRPIMPLSYVRGSSLQIAGRDNGYLVVPAKPQGAVALKRPACRQA